jgi:dihydroneopterin aldolase
MSKLSTLFVSNLVFSGIHGQTGRERLDRQRFRVDLKICLDISRAKETDLLDDTYDYKNALEIAKHVIENENHVLIERIASRIAERICSNSKIDSVEVTVGKLNASTNGLPGIVYSHVRSPQDLDQRIEDFNVHEMLKKLEMESAVSIPILSGRYRQALLNEAETYKYKKQPEVVGPMKVKEQLSSSYSLCPGSLFFQLKEDFENYIEGRLKRDEFYPFSPKLQFNELSLQLYEKGSIGITPHLDGFSHKNLICVFILTGVAKFAICTDRGGSNPRYLDASPGNVIVMRAPGFMNSDFRPFHLLTDVTERRIVFGLRQKVRGKVTSR